MKRNDLLFDLINGCDVTRISEIGWWAWHRQDQAIALMRLRTHWAAMKVDRYRNYLTREFRVKFSRPVRKDTLKPDCFAMTVMKSEPRDGWWQVYRVPIVDIDTTLVDREGTDPVGHVRSARIVVSGGWLADAVDGSFSIFQGGETRVEIEVRGDLIEDCNNQTVDANTRGCSPFPSGNNQPGGSFLSTFTVDARIASNAKASAQPAEGVVS